MAANQVSNYNFLQAGAPTLNGTVSSKIAVLDACLVNGWGSQTATSLVVAGTTATLTLPSTPAMVVDGLVTVAGATLAGFVNGDYRVLTIAGNVLTFAVSGVTAGAATGTITAKVTSLGWTKAFSGTNLAVYKSSNVAATGVLLRVDDTGAQVARVVGYETMSDVNTGTGAFPTSAIIAGGLYWGKSNSADSTARQWHVVGDDRTFYMTMGTVNTASLTVNTNGATGHGFGDMIPVNSADAYAAFLCGFENSTTPYNSGSLNNGELSSLGDILSSVNTRNGFFAPRAYSQISTAVRMMSVIKGIGLQQTASGASTAGFPFPNPANNGLIVAKQGIVEATSYRGDFPGLFNTPHNLQTNTPLKDRDKIVGTGSLAGRKLMFLRTSTPNGTSMSGCNFFDITGPWR